MQYRTILMTALTAAVLLAGCEQASVASPDPARSEPAVSVSGTFSPSAPDQTEPVASASEPDSSPGTSQPEPAASASTPGSGMPTEPTQTPADPEMTAGEEILLAAYDSADWSWFDDAVFVGDSVSYKLQNYVIVQRRSDPGFFGGAQFLTSLSLGSGNALWEVSDQSVHPTYQGEKMRLERSVPLTGAKKVYMMLGMNDIAVYGIGGAIENYCRLMDLILENAPGVEFYIQSVTPICQGCERGSLNNANLAQYNAALERMCRDRGIHFVDVAQVMRDANGYLPRKYCIDPDEMGIHVTDLACRMWLGYLSMDAHG